MFNIKNIIVTIALLSLFGSTLIGFFDDLGYLIACNFCEDARQQIIKDVADLTTAGQQKIIDGVDGILRLKEDNTIDPATKKGLLTMYRNEVYVGLLLSLIYIAIIAFLLTAASRLIVGFEPPLLMTLIISFLLVGLLTSAATGFTTFPYEGFVKLFQHWNEVFGKEVVEAVSPVPLNTTYNLT